MSAFAFRCSYTRYNLVQVHHGLDDRSSGDRQSSTHKLVLTLSPKSTAVRVETEELTYDLSNVLGDVGGALGLLLGASVVSAYDWLKERVRNGRRRGFFNVPLLETSG